MKINKLLIVIAACLLVTSTFAVLQVFAVQPPLKTDTYYIGTIGQPRRLDPARAYDTASGDVIMNVYETLVFFDDKDKMSDTGNSNNASDPTTWANLSSFEPILATALPTISPDGKTWTFTINENAQFPSWIKGDHTVYPATNLTARDVEYSLERILVQDMAGSPSWMFCMPLSGNMWLFASGAYNKTSFASRSACAALIDGFVTTAGTTVTLNFGYAWPPTAIMQILAQSWGGIGQEAFCVEHGCWNGSYYDDGVSSTSSVNWAMDYCAKPSSSYGPLDRYYAKSKYTAGDTTYNSPTSPGDVPAMLGTGPYKFTSWDKVNKVWRMDWNPAYWRFWVDAGDGAGNFLKVIIERGVDVWPTRKMLFLEGEFDNCAVPRANMYDLLASGDYIPIEGVKLFYGHAGLANEMAPFVFQVAAGSPYHSKILGVTVDDFFGNYYVRSAFSYALNYPAYLSGAWFGEAIQQDSWWVDGLEPSYFKNTALVHKTVNTTRIQEDLQKAFFPAAGPNSVWVNGFETYLIYNLGNDQRKIACDMIAAVFSGLGAKYKVNVVGIDWPTFLDYEEEMYMPMFFVGWLADFADCDNFARPYMHTYGDFSYFQSYSNATVDALIDSSILMPNNSTREANYKELQREYYQAAIGLPICQATGRRWVRDWVKGWYYNQLYPGGYYYDQVYKEYTGSVDNIDLDVTGTITRVTFYPVIYWYQGKGLIGNGNGNYAIYEWSVHVKRNDNDPLGPAFVFSVVGMKRVNSTGWLEFCNATTVSVPKGSDATVSLKWYEDATVPQNFAPNCIWNMSGAVYPVAISANDTNLGNNEVSDPVGMTANTPLVGDIKVDGIVDIFDAIQLANAFGKSTGETGFNAAADLKVDGTIDIFDAILLANHFNEHIP